MPKGIVRPLPFTCLTAKQIAKYHVKYEQRGLDECWPWIAAVSQHGRGLMTINKENVRSTRVGWFIRKGSDPFPLHVLHKCDNPSCENPAHWFLGTNDDNIHDRNRKDRGGRKLTPAQVAVIKRLLREGQRSQQSIADEFGVHQTCIGFIKRSVWWRHVA